MCHCDSDLGGFVFMRFGAAGAPPALVAFDVLLSWASSEEEMIVELEGMQEIKAHCDSALEHP